MSSAPPPSGDPTQRLPPAHADSAPQVAEQPAAGSAQHAAAAPLRRSPTNPGANLAAGGHGSSNGAGRTGTGYPAGANGAVNAVTTADLGTPDDSEQTAVLARPAGQTTDAPDQSLTVPWHRHGTGPVGIPVPRVRHRWRKIVLRTLSKAWSDSLFGLSSQAAFWCALSTAPLLLALLGMIGYIVPHYFPPGTIDQVRDQVLLFLNTIFNEEVANTLVGNTVETILGNGQADVVSIGLVISLWAGSSAMSAFVESITIAYNQHEERHPVAERFFALGLYLVALLAGILMLPLLAIGPDYLPRLFPQAWRPEVSNIVNLAYYPVLAVLLIFMLTVLYKVAPKHKHPWYRGIPGALLAAAVFIVASFGLRLYLSYVYSHGLTYGALATPITFLLFYYFVSMAIIIGAQFNNAMLEFYPPKPSKRELRKWQHYDDEQAASA